jgi:2-polyprenyl-3-methyl-5-hydroxy-6-metoxy-1,4-benzoquinol methylase
MKNARMKFVKDRDSNPLVPGHYYLFNWIKPFMKKNSKILDIGCWSGPLEELFSQEKCHVTGIDIEDEPIEYARKKFPNFTFLKASIIDPLPLRKKTFDIAAYFMVIEHIPKGTELDSLIQINRVLKSSGQLFINTMSYNVLSNLLDPMFFLGHRHYTRKELTRLLKKSGFSIKEIKYNGGLFTTLHIFLLYFFKHVLKKQEPRNKILDKLMELDYKDRGFVEIDIRAEKIKDK